MTDGAPGKVCMGYAEDSPISAARARLLVPGRCCSACGRLHLKCFPVGISEKLGSCVYVGSEN